MTIKFTPDGKVDRRQWHIRTLTGAEGRRDADALADVIDECVAALRLIAITVHPTRTQRVAVDALRKIGAEP